MTKMAILLRGFVLRLAISKKDIAVNPGPYPVYSSSIMNNGIIGTYGEYMFDDTRLTWSIDGGGKFFYRENERYSVTNVCGWLRVLDEQKVSPKYLYYALSNQWETLTYNYVNKAHPSVIQNDYVIPLPPIEVQRYIVSILDRFEQLCGDLTGALPKEIEAAQKRYEYYRDLLLNFGK